MKGHSFTIPVVHGWLDVTKRLVEHHDCDPVISDNEGETPLHEACREGHLDVVLYLVNQKRIVSVVCFNKDGNTPLDLACENGHHNVVDFLMEWDINTAWQCRKQISSSSPFVSSTCGKEVSGTLQV